VKRNNFANSRKTNCQSLMFAGDPRIGGRHSQLSPDQLKEFWHEELNDS
jgi:hypothetical protein